MKKVCGNTDFHRLFIYILIPFFMEPFSLPRGCPHPRSRCVPGGIDNLPQPKRNTAVVLCCLPSGVLQPRHTAPPLRCGRHHGSAVRQKDGTTPMEAPRKFYSSMLLRSNTLSVLERYSRRLNGNVDSIGYGVTLIDKLRYEEYHMTILHDPTSSKVIVKRCSPVPPAANAPTSWPE
jgi:hypothetical protein